jgi:hypothetical protein
MGNTGTRNWADATDKQLARLAAERVLGAFPTAPYEDQRAAARRMLETLKSHRTKELAARQGAASQNAEEGGYSSLETIEPPQMQSMMDAQKTGVPWRMTEQQSVDKVIKSGDLSPEELSNYRLRGKLPEWAENIKAQTMVHDRFGPPSKSIHSPFGEFVRTISAPYNFVAGAMTGTEKKLAEIAGEAPAGVERYHGIPQKQMGEAIRANPSKGLDVIKEAWKGATDAASSYGDSDYEWASHLKQVSAKYGAAADKAAGQYLADEFKRTGDPVNLTPEKHEALKQDIYDKLLEHEDDRFSVEYPNAAEGIRSLALDPLNWVSPVAAARSVAKAATKIPVAGEYIARGLNTAGKASNKVQQGLSAVPEAVEAKLMTGEGGTKLSNALFNAPEQADAEVSMLAERLERGPLQTAERIAKTPEELNQVMDALTGQIPGGREALPAKLHGAYDALVQMRTELATNKDTAGLGRHFAPNGLGEESHVLQPPVVEENMVPRRLFDKPFEKQLKREQKSLDEFGPLEQQRYRTLRPSSDYERKLTEEQVRERLVRNPIAQFRAELEDLSPKLKAAKEYKIIRESLERNGYLKDVTDLKPEQIDAHLEQASKDTGVKWVDLGNDKDLKELFLRTTGKPGITASYHNYVMPELAAKRLKAIAIRSDPKDVPMILKGYEAFAEHFMRPLTNTARKGQVLLVPGAQATNYVGAVSLGYLGLGLKALDPRLQGAAHAAATLATLPEYGKLGALAKGTRETLGKTPWTMQGGTKSKLGDIIPALKQHGILTDSFQGFTTSTGKKTLDKAWKIPSTAAAGINNYQRIILALGHLKDLSPESLQATATFVSEFAGNAARLPAKERKYLGDTFMYYTWLRFSLPRIVKSLAEHPQRVNAFTKINSSLEHKYGSNAPYPAEDLPKYLRGKGFTSPPGMQRDRIKALMEEGKAQTYSHNFAVSVIDGGAQFLGAPLLGILGGDPDASIRTLFTPLAGALVDLITGYNVKGEKRAPIIATDSPEDFMSSMTGRHLYGTVERPYEVWKNMWDLARKNNMPGTEMELKAICRAGNDMQSLFGYGHPGMRTYDVSPVTTGIYQERGEAIKAAADREKQLRDTP